MTPAEQLVKAQDDLKAAQQLNTEAADTLKAKTTEATNEKARADKAEGDLKAMTARAEKAEGDLKASQETVAKLEKEKKSTDGAAAEQLARNGVTAGTKVDEEAVRAGNGDDVAALGEKFMKASMNDKRALLAGKDGERLRAYIAEQSRKQANG